MDLHSAYFVRTIASRFFSDSAISRKMKFCSGYSIAYKVSAASLDPFSELYLPSLSALPMTSINTLQVANE